MSHTRNTIWKENCYQNFQGYLEENNREMAEAAIGDMWEAGFEKEAHDMKVELDSHKDPYDVEPYNE